MAPSIIRWQLGAIWVEVSMCGATEGLKTQWKFSWACWSLMFSLSGLKSFWKLPFYVLLDHHFCNIWLNETRLGYPCLEKKNYSVVSRWYNLLRTSRYIAPELSVLSLHCEMIRHDQWCVDEKALLWSFWKSWAPASKPLISHFLFTNVCKFSSKWQVSAGTQTSMMRKLIADEI